MANLKRIIKTLNQNGGISGCMARLNRYDGLGEVLNMDRETDCQLKNPQGFCQLCGVTEGLYCSACLIKDIDNYTASLRASMLEAAEKLQATVEYAQEMERLLNIQKEHNDNLSKDLEDLKRMGGELNELAHEYLVNKPKKTKKKK